MDTFPMMALITACFLVLLLIACSAALDSISPFEYLSDGKTLVSADGSFELGFFSPGSSRNRYVGIWYRNIPARTVVWVANRVAPVNDSSGILTVKKTGEVQIILSQNHVIWSVKLNKEAQRPKLRLLDSGNLVLVEEGNGNSGTYLWQSFDHPSDTLLPGMKLGWDLKTGFERRITAWKSSDDPSPGEFSWGIELHGNPESVMRMGSKEYFRGGPYNGQHFVGTESSRPNPVVDSRYVFNEEEAVYVFYLKNKSLISRVLVNQTDYTTQRYLWSEETQTWNLYSYMPRDYCDSYRRCGAYSYCDNTLVPPCNCLKGFQPISPTRWLSMDWSEGCRRNKPLNCKKDGFVRFKTLKLPDATHSWINKSMNLKECRTKCLHNCSCTAYTSFDVRGGGSGCAIWFGDLLDIRQFQSGGQDLYVRMSASESDSENKSRTKIALMFAIPLAVLLVVFIVCYFLYKRKRNLEEGKVLKREDCNESEVQEEDMDLPVFQLATLSHATNSFSLANKLGQGGFGPVYKGMLIDGREIAVKRLCKSSGQGLTEFKNEVKLIAKLQHRNLVRLLGCCLEGEEKLLVYEYMPKGSLDSLIFDQSGRKELNWSKRFHIICGIARGLLYLHQDSRLRIIHRDLKASNVLLDNEMNPKISDFGMAKTFGGDQTEGNTTRVVGTYGYMAPEYAIDGLFSVKSDVFSFGVLLMELVSGIKSRGLFHSDSCINLIGHAWSLWKGSKPLDLVDQLLEESCPLYEVVRCIQISLLCVQQHPEDRPTMSSVLLMLGSEVELPQPKQPGFLLENAALETDSSLGKHDSASVNNITITLLQAR